MQRKLLHLFVDRGRLGSRSGLDRMRSDRVSTAFCYYASLGLLSGHRLSFFPFYWLPLARGPTELPGLASTDFATSPSPLRVQHRCVFRASPPRAGLPTARALRRFTCVRIGDAPMTPPDLPSRDGLRGAPTSCLVLHDLVLQAKALVSSVLGSPHRGPRLGLAPPICCACQAHPHGSPSTRGARRRAGSTPPPAPPRFEEAML